MDRVDLPRSATDCYETNLSDNIGNSSFHSFDSLAEYIEFV